MLNQSPKSIQTKRLDTITLSNRYNCLNLNRMSDSTDTDSDDDYTKIIFDDLCGDTIAEQTGVILETTEERMVQFTE